MVRKPSYIRASRSGAPGLANTKGGLKDAQGTQMLHLDRDGDAQVDPLADISESGTSW